MASSVRSAPTIAATGIVLDSARAVIRRCWMAISTSMPSAWAGYTAGSGVSARSTSLRLRSPLAVGTLAVKISVSAE